MKFFFDDSGDFALPEDLENKVSLWMGILIPETCEKRVEKKFLENLLLKNKNNVSRAAKEAGMHRVELQRLLKKYK